MSKWHMTANIHSPLLVCDLRDIADMQLLLKLHSHRKPFETPMQPIHYATVNENNVAKKNRY